MSNKIKSIDVERMDFLSSAFNELSKTLPNHKHQCILMYAFNSFKELCANAVQIEASLKAIGVALPCVSTLADFLDFVPEECDSGCASSEE